LIAEQSQALDDRPSKVRRRMLTEQGSSLPLASSETPRSLRMRRQRTEQSSSLIVLPHFQLDAFSELVGAN
jgi:hypothetical protein